VTVVIMGEMSLDDWDEKSEKNDQHEVDGMRQEDKIIPKTRRCITK